MANKRPITGPILGLPNLDYEVTIEVRNKHTGAKNSMYYPNVGRVQTDHILATEMGVEGEQMMELGMPQALLMVVGFNASPGDGKTLIVKDGGAMGVAEGGAENG